MYFPILRGKQFELIALREISNLLSGSNHIRPIIEPVKKKTSTYAKTIDVLCQRNINFTVVINPSVGNLQNRISDNCEKLLPPAVYTNFQIGINATRSTNFAMLAEILRIHGLSDNNIILIISDIDQYNLQELINFIDHHTITQILVGSQPRNRRNIIRELRRGGNELVILSDPFNKKIRNKDYLEDIDEFFSEEHAFFNEDGFGGFADYLTVGEDYSDKGYTPYAVAVHLTYFHTDNQSLRIHHFVSDSNEDNRDIGGKWEEARGKLVRFINQINLHTRASEEFRKLHDEDKYPGLGSIKKLSMLNHLELIHSYFSE